jgi:GNAT superfamily N-acetyltransferase
MRATFHQTAKRFLGAAEGFLLSDPLSTNVVAVLAGRIAAEAQPRSDDYLWATVEDDDGRVLGVAMHTPPHGLFVSRMPAGAAAVLAGALADAGRALPGVNGAVSAIAPFAGAWAALTGQASTVVTAMRMYQLGELARPSGVPGRPAVAAAPADVALAASWFGAFHDEAQPRAPVEDWRALAERRVAAGEVHLWHDGGAPVAVAAVSAPAAGVARVGPVYTPAGQRRRGYGAAVTAEATAAALTGGAEHVTLYTDLANPTSNSIYQAIGYRPDHDAEERTFQ